MRYSGSKKRFARYIVPILENALEHDDIFIDLFGGGMNIVCEVDCKIKLAYDYNRYVIALWNELKENGMKNIPEKLDEDTYYDMKRSYIDRDGRYPDYILGYVGNACSYGSAWWNGYARFNERKNEDHIGEAYRGLERQLEKFKELKGTVFTYDSYDRVELPRNSVIYCDPPYASTKKYESDFDSEKFFEWVREMTAKGYKIFISEYDAPSDFVCIWEKDKKDGMGTSVKGKRQGVRTEKVFVHRDFFNRIIKQGGLKT